MDNLLEQIKDFKKCVKSDNSDYLTGYLAALSAVEGMIEARRMNMSDNKVRLIDANIVIQKLKSYYNKLSPSIYSEIIRRDEVSSCIAELINAPTAEASPCEFCKYDGSGNPCIACPATAKEDKDG